jgi:hypothetical protein
MSMLLYYSNCGNELYQSSFPKYYWGCRPERYPFHNSWGSPIYVFSVLVRLASPLMHLIMLDLRDTENFLTRRTIRLPPLDIIEKWPPPNYTHPVTRGPTVVIVSIICACLALSAVGMRFYTRLRILKNPGMDDLLVALALVGLLLS